MTQFGQCLGFVAPYYNLVFVIIVIILFLYLFKKADKKTHLTPWKLLLTAILIYVVEAILTVLIDINLISISKLIAPILEMGMISLFIYVFLSQKEYLKNVKK